MAKTRKSLPKTEILWTTYVADGGHEMYLTSGPLRDKYNLWNKNGDTYELVSSSKTPSALIKTANKMLDDESQSKPTRRKRGKQNG